MQIMRYVVKKKTMQLYKNYYNCLWEGGQTVMLFILFITVLYIPLFNKNLLMSSGVRGYQV